MLTSRAKHFPRGARIGIGELALDPYPVLAQLRHEEPVSWVGALGMWFVTGYDDVVSVLRDPETFTTDSPHSTIRDTFGRQVLSTDGTDHRRHKRACQPPFAAASVERTWASGVERICSELLDELERTRTRTRDDAIELVAGLAEPLSLRTMGLVLGLADEALPLLRECYASFAQSLQNFERDPGVRERGRNDAARLRAELARRLRGAAEGPDSETLIGHLAGKGGAELDEEEMVANLSIVLFGGIETTESMIGNTLWALLEHPEVLASLREEVARGGTERLDAAIEEALRWEPAVQSCTRHATRDCSLRGVDIARGETVQCMIGGANRDPRVFPEPDRFEPTRFLGARGAPRHLAFGLASHFCLGAWLARLETRTVVRSLLRRYERLDKVPGRADAPRGHEFRKPPQLWVLAT